MIEVKKYIATIEGVPVFSSDYHKKDHLLMIPDGRGGKEVIVPGHFIPDEDLLREFINVWKNSDGLEFEFKPDNP